jgi:hypothetical protein
MTTEQKIIRAKVGVLELAKQLGNVSQACKMMGYSRDSAATLDISWRYEICYFSQPAMGPRAGDSPEVLSPGF